MILDSIIFRKTKFDTYESSIHLRFDDLFGCSFCPKRYRRRTSFQPKKLAKNG